MGWQEYSCSSSVVLVQAGRMGKHDIELGTPSPDFLAWEYLFLDRWDGPEEFGVDVVWIIGGGSCYDGRLPPFLRGMETDVCRIPGDGSCVVEESVADFGEERDRDHIQGSRWGGNGRQILWFYKWNGLRSLRAGTWNRLRGSWCCRTWSTTKYTTYFTFSLNNLYILLISGSTTNFLRPFKLSASNPSISLGVHFTSNSSEPPSSPPCFYYGDTRDRIHHLRLRRSTRCSCQSQSALD